MSSRNRNSARPTPADSDLPPVATTDPTAGLPPVNAPRFAPLVAEDDNDEALDAIRHRTVLVAGEGIGAASGYYDPNSANQGVGIGSGPSAGAVEPAQVRAQHAFSDSDQARRQIEAEYHARLAQLQPAAPAVDIASTVDPDIGFLYVLDRSATHRAGTREHELILADGEIRPFAFEPFKGTRLPFEIAMRFLKSEGFVLVDATNQVIPFKKLPKRPEELEAGEQLKVGMEETIARYDELTDRALAMRVAQLPGSEVIVRRGSRDEMVKFIVDFYQLKARQNARRENMNIDDLEGFTPAAEVGDF